MVRRYRPLRALRCPVVGRARTVSRLGAQGQAEVQISRRQVHRAAGLARERRGDGGGPQAHDRASARDGLEGAGRPGKARHHVEGSLQQPCVGRSASPDRGGEASGGRGKAEILKIGRGSEAGTNFSRVARARPDLPRTGDRRCRHHVRQSKALGRTGHAPGQSARPRPHDARSRERARAGPDDAACRYRS
jgi:hypothetical protein